MAQASHSTATLRGSPLVRTLSDLCNVSGDASRQRLFATRLGSLIDLPDSITLAGQLANLSSSEFRPDVVSTDGLRKAFLEGRAHIIRSILRACHPGPSASKIRLPEITAETPAEEALDPAPCIAFYIAQQSELDYKVRRLHQQIRGDAAGLSPRLARLAALDGALAEAVGGGLRKHFGVVPALLGQHFDALSEEYRASLKGGEHDGAAWLTWRKRLHRDIRNLLLAEADTRLLPALGLIEALDENTD